MNRNKPGNRNQDQGTRGTVGRAANLEVLDMTALETKGGWTVQTKEKKNTAVAANAAAFAGLMEQSTGIC
jgi:hypothetical protein